MGCVNFMYRDQKKISVIGKKRLLKWNNKSR